MLPNYAINNVSMSIKTCQFCKSLMLCAINSSGSSTENLIDVIDLLNMMNMFMKSVCLLHIHLECTGAKKACGNCVCSSMYYTFPTFLNKQRYVA